MLYTAVCALTVALTGCRAAPQDTASVRRTVALPARSPSTPPKALAVPLEVERFERGDGEALVSNGIPLPPGALHPAQLDYVDVTVGGASQPAYVEPLGAPREDGSIPALLVQFRLDGAATRDAVVLRIGQRAATRRRAKTEVTASLPAAAAFPADAGYVIGTGIVGDTRPVADARRQSKFLRTYESNFIHHANAQWKRYGHNWEAVNYYDRALVYYAFWARTGSATYWERAARIAADYREKYLVNNAYRSSPHWAQLEGLAVHYLLTGDERSRKAVAETARTLHIAFGGERLGQNQHQWMDNRIQARVLAAKLLARRVGLTTGTTDGWARELRTDLDRILATQGKDGAYRFKNQCMQSSNFMAGLLNDALALYYTEFERDPRIPAAIKRNVDWLWTTQWRGDGSFNYYSGSCHGGGATAAPDVNLLLVNGFGFVYRMTGDARYRTWGDEVFAAGVAKAYLNGTKQFNESYASSWRYLAYRR